MALIIQVSKLLIKETNLTLVLVVEQFDLHNRLVITKLVAMVDGSHSVVSVWLIISERFLEGRELMDLIINPAPVV